MKLTKRVLDELSYDRKSGGQYAWDDDLAGFGVRIYPSDRKVFVITYRTRDGHQRFYTLGRYGEMTLHEARTQAMESLAATRRGEDPGGERQAYRRAPTMADLAERYMRDHARPRKKPRGAESDERMWRLHVLPRFKKRKVAEITRADIFGLHAEMASMRYQANRVLALLSKAFNLCEIWGWRPDGSNPCRHVSRYREERRERFLSSEELMRLADALTEVERLRCEEPSAIAAIRLLILTGCRSGEITKLRWQEVDFERRCLRLADTKTGRRPVYLNSAALQVLAGIEPEHDNPYVIVGAKSGSHLFGLTRPWFRIRKRAGLEDVRLHDLRHTYASVGAGIGLSLPILGKLLGHTVAATTERYAHLAADPVREASERVGSELTAAMGGIAGGAEVRQFVRKRRSGGLPYSVVKKR